MVGSQKFYKPYFKTSEVSGVSGFDIPRLAHIMTSMLQNVFELRSRRLRSLDCVSGLGATLHG